MTLPLNDDLHKELSKIANKFGLPIEYVIETAINELDKLNKNKK
ncbi:Uncharacterised protein [[Clostridium] sordellii]|nr:hypothetical protein [Paeniclostridium sordellii]CEP39626.1 Uncharacterised protein [[Clostridium] sordellii] [Paeniclostridium sordellii]